MTLAARTFAETLCVHRDQRHNDAYRLITGLIDKRKTGEVSHVESLSATLSLTLVRRRVRTGNLVQK